jgi:hypothetical protein
MAARIHRVHNFVKLVKPAAGARRVSPHGEARLRIAASAAAKFTGTATFSHDRTLSRRRSAS